MEGIERRRRKRGRHLVSVGSATAEGRIDLTEE
jgi:hypothetical protein